MAKVPVARYMGQDQTVTANGNTYDFVNHGGVSMCWVEEADLPAVLAMYKLCCGGRKKRYLFQPANQNQVDFWSKV